MSQLPNGINKMLPVVLSSIRSLQDVYCRDQSEIVLQGTLQVSSKEESRCPQEISGAKVLQSTPSQSATLTDILLETMHMITQDLIPRVGSLGAIRAPGLTNSRCRFENLGAFAPAKGEH